MADQHTKQKRGYLDQIETLLEESYALPSSTKSWERRTEIEWEIVVLCRKIAKLSSGPPPYWSEEEQGTDETPPDTEA